MEAAADLNKQAPYLSVQRKYGKQVYKAHYAFKEEYAMIETGYAQTEGDLPLVKVSLLLAKTAQEASAGKVCKFDCSNDFLSRAAITLP